MSTTSTKSNTYTTFAGTEKIASGTLVLAAVAAHEAHRSKRDKVLVFNDKTGAVVDVDLAGDASDVAARIEVEYASCSDHVAAPAASPPKRGRGRPRLGVVAREVTLLPEQWAWLAGRSRSASATLRLLVQREMRANRDKDAERAATNRAYAFLTAVAGDLPGFEEASRALFGGDRDALNRHMDDWPHDIRVYTTSLLATD